MKVRELRPWPAKSCGAFKKTRCINYICSEWWSYTPWGDLRELKKGEEIKKSTLIKSFMKMLHFLCYFWTFHSTLRAGSLGVPSPKSQSCQQVRTWRQSPNFISLSKPLKCVLHPLGSDLDCFMQKCSRGLWSKLGIAFLLNWCPGRFWA